MNTGVTALHLPPMMGSECGWVTPGKVSIS